MAKKHWWQCLKQNLPAIYKTVQHGVQRDFGENYVAGTAENTNSYPKTSAGILLGHLQSNKVKYIAPCAHLIHGVDSFNLLKEINKQAAKHNRIIDCLLQIHIIKKKPKFGFDELN